MLFYLSQHVVRNEAGPAGEIYDNPYLEIIDQGVIVNSCPLLRGTDEQKQKQAMALARILCDSDEPKFLTFEEFHAMFPNINANQ